MMMKQIPDIRKEKEAWGDSSIFINNVKKFYAILFHFTNFYLHF